MDVLDLPPTTDSVPAARRFTRAALRGSHCDVDTAVLLVSELVTNAVLHARSSIVLSVEDRDASARVEVRDRSPLSPRLHRFAIESATGRGLRMLEQLSRGWGVEVQTAGAGKVVWFEVGMAAETSWDSFADDLMVGGVPGDL